LDGFAGYDDGIRLYTRGDGKKGSDRQVNKIVIFIADHWIAITISSIECDAKVS
jgi:hypothetical protein